VTVRTFDLQASDVSWMRQLNNAVVPHIPAIEAGALDRVRKAAALAIGVEVKGVPAGFVLGMDPGADHDSSNYKWFQARFGGFLYIDRVVVDSRYRGKGLGRRLYEEAEARAAANAVPLTCEVNEVPPNPGSLSFHEAVGFRPIGIQTVDGGCRSVVMLLKPTERRAQG
jgi:predicted GNAT superfamily acetyltransferase